MQNNGVDIEDVLYESTKLPDSSYGMDGYNNSHYFMLPLFDVRGIAIFKNNYVGTYVQDASRVCNIETPLFILFRFKKMDNAVADGVNNYFYNFPGYKFNYYAGHNEGNLVCYVLKAKEEDRECYNTILRGEYSKVPEWYINRCTTFPFKFPTRKRLRAICLQEEWHKEQMENKLGLTLDGTELWNKFEPSMEVYRYVQKKEIDPTYIN